VINEAKHVPSFDCRLDERTNSDGTGSARRESARGTKTSQIPNWNDFLTRKAPNLAKRLSTGN
jgi:hypothetical protein